MATEVLQKLDQDQLYKMVRQEGLKGDEDTSSKKLIESLREAVEEIGINQVTGNMKKDSLDKMIAPLKIEVPVNDKGVKLSVSKQVIRRRIQTSVAEEGASKFFADLDEDILEEFFEACPTDEDQEKGKKKLASQVARLVAQLGLQVFFGRFNVDFLQDLMDSCKLKYNTNNQNALSMALAYQQPALKEKKKAAKSPKFSSKKLPIEKGITYQDIFQHYYAEDLHEYCKEHELKNSGTKKEIINRILAYLDGDESTKIGASPKRKRSSSASRSKKAGSKSPKKSGKKSSKKESDDKEEKDDDDKEEEKKESKKSSKKSKGDKDKKSDKKSDKKEEKDEKEDEE